MAAPQQQISDLLQQHIQSGDFPSAVYLVSEHGGPSYADALGHSTVQPYSVSSNLNTIYDLASLTKPLITGLLCSRRIEAGELTLDSSVSHAKRFASVLRR